VNGVSVTERRHIDVHEAWLPEDHPLHRPRHGGRQLTALICAGLFFLSPIVALSWVDADRFENRPLAAFPDPRDGWGFFTGLPAWGADRLPFRQDAVRTGDALSRSVFGEPAPLPPVGPEGPVQPGPHSTDSERISVSAFPRVIEGTDGWLYLGTDVSGACAPSRSINETLGSLRRLRSVVEGSGRRFVLLVAPDKTTMVPQHLPADYLGRDCAARARAEFWPRVLDEAGAIDMRPALEQIARRTGSPAYYPADTHWSPDGGLAMTYALAERIKPDVTRTWQVDPSGSTPWPDDISPLLGRSGERTIPTYSLAPDGRADRTTPVASDFRTPVRLTSEPTRGTIDQPVRMIADSYTQFASRYLAASFTDIAVVHPETVAAAPRPAGELLAEGEIVVMEVAERHLLSGTSPILLQPVINEIGQQLASHPIR